MAPTILVVDDEAQIRSLLKRLLELEGIGVVTAPDGATALRVFRDVQPDLVLLDVMMPDLDGFEVCRRLKNDPATMFTPVVLVTGLNSVDDRVRGIEAGTDDFLSKPFERVELMARIRSLLRVKGYTDQLEQAESVVLTLARSIEGRDPYTEGHCERLSEFGSRLGKHLGMADEEITALRRAGYVHDIGKVVVPDAILLKQDGLTPEEKNVIQRHPVVGEHICRGLRSFKLVLPIVRHHHEKLDGSGYPDGLRGDEIPMTARILQIVDVYDALTTSRPYKPALPQRAALQTLEREVEREWWDPAIFVEFRRMLESGEMFKLPD